MPAAKSVLTATQEPNKHVFDSFKEHSSGVRTETKTTVLGILRDAYPDYHVTEVDSGQVSLIDFAGADKATIVFDSEEENFNATRKWRPVGEGVQKKLHPGKLDDEFWFARFQYIWEGKEYLVYYITWEDTFRGAKKNFYILHPRTEANVVDGHCTDTDELVIAAGKWSSQLHEEIFVFDDGHWDKSKDLWRSVHGSSWEDVILDPEMKKNLIEDVQGFFDNQQLYGQFAVPWKRGIIFHGVPGNGKTVSIKALMSSLDAREDQIPSLYVKSFENNCQTEQYAIRQIFLQARKCAPCLLIFEDLDSLVNDDIRSYFLNEVDGLESNDGILMIGSTNHLDKLDPAIAKRPSRFDRKYHFKLPSEEERKLYVEYWRKKLLKNETVEFPEELCSVVAQLTEGFSFAYLKELFVMALLSLVRGFKGDDFEIVDSVDAESAKAEDDADAKAEEKTETKEEVCTCAKTCGTCNKPFPKETPAANEAMAEIAGEAAGASGDGNKKMVMPSVDIPEHLAENLLLKVVKHQIRVLHSEMDNTKDDKWPSGKKAVGGNMSRGAMNKAMMMRMMRGRC